MVKTSVLHATAPDCYRMMKAGSTIAKCVPGQGIRTQDLKDSHLKVMAVDENNRLLD